jgi:hypothetical protein
VNEKPSDERESVVLRDGEAFFDDFDTWATRLALEDLLDEALSDWEIVADLHREGLRAEDARQAVLTSVSALARVRMERDRSLAPAERSRWFLIRPVSLREAGWLLVAGALMVGYLRVLQLSWQATPLFFKLVGVLGLGAVCGLCVQTLGRRVPGLFAAEGWRHAGDWAHPELIGLGDRRDFALREIVLPGLRDYIRDNRQTHDRVNLVFEDPDDTADLEAGLVRTAAVQRLRRIIDRAESVAVALAGHRGTGKTTSIRSLEQGLLSRSDQKPPLVVVASAPAAYEARDFVLHLHALLCKEIGRAHV